MEKHNLSDLSKLILSNDLGNLSKTLVSKSMEKNPEKFKKHQNLLKALSQLSFDVDLDLEVDVNLEKKDKEHHNKKCECKHKNDECECKAKLHDYGYYFKIFADICPDCKEKKSEVTASYSNNYYGFLFKSKDITKPICEKTYGYSPSIVGTSLNTGGTGKVVTNDGTFDASFSLSLFEHIGNVNQDSYAFTVSWIGKNGYPYTFYANTSYLDDNRLIIKKCKEHDYDQKCFSEDSMQKFTGDAVANEVKTTRVASFSFNGATKIVDLDDITPDPV